MNNHVENKRIFSEAEKDAIIEEILEEKPWEGFGHSMAFFLRNNLFLMHSYIISLYIPIVALVNYDELGSPYVFWLSIICSISVVFFGHKWTNFISCHAPNLQTIARQLLNAELEKPFVGNEKGKNISFSNKYVLLSLFLFIACVFISDYKNYSVLSIFFIIFISLLTFAISSASSRFLCSIKGNKGNKELIYFSYDKFGKYLKIRKLFDYISNILDIYSFLFFLCIEIGFILALLADIHILWKCTYSIFITFCAISTQGECITYLYDDLIFEFRKKIYNLTLKELKDEQ